jgi:general stress protein YciG
VSNEGLNCAAPHGANEGLDASGRPGRERYLDADWLDADLCLFATLRAAAEVSQTRLICTGRCPALIFRNEAVSPFLHVRLGGVAAGTGTWPLEREIPDREGANLMIRSSVFPIMLLPLAAFAFEASAQELTALKVEKAPVLTAGAGDPAWGKAQPLSVQLAGGANFKGGMTTATLKAVYSGDTLYMLVQYDDPTESVRRSPYQKQADGSWTKVKDPDDKGGDNTKFYEDKFALIWNIGGSIKNFSQMGCMATCHLGETKPYGNKYTASEGELGDIWHMKTIRTGAIGQIDDQFVDHTRYDKDKAPEAGRKGDAKTGGGYADIKLVNGKPEFMHKSGTPANKPGGTYYLKEADKAPFDDSKFKAGDEVASILIAPFTGDRADIPAAIAWKDGKWTYVLSRKLVTGSKTDVQFDKLDGTYEFGMAAFDNAQVRHAFQVGALKLKFAK